MEIGTVAGMSFQLTVTAIKRPYSDTSYKDVIQICWCADNTYYTTTNQDLRNSYYYFTLGTGNSEFKK